MAENVNPAKCQGASLGFSPFGVPYLCKVGGPRLQRAGLAGFRVHALGKYLDPKVDRDRRGPRTRHTGVPKFMGTILMAWGTRGH